MMSPLTRLRGMPVLVRTPESDWLAELLAHVTRAKGVGGMAAAAWAASRWLTRATPGTPARTPGDLGLRWEKVACRTADLCQLNGWIVTPPLPRATVALFHGIRADRTQTLERVAFLADAGFRCVAFDHRAHGASTGNRTSFGYHESRDVIAVLNLVRQRWPAQRCAALGIAMGGAAICYAGAHLKGVDAIILENVYANIRRAFTTGGNRSATVRQFGEGVIAVTERRLGVKLEQLAPVNYIAGLAPTPVLFVTGGDDASHQLLRQRYPGPAEDVRVASDLGTPSLAYLLRVLDFLERRFFHQAAA